MLDYEIEGSNLELVRIRLEAGTEVYAEAGRMIYKTPDVKLKATMRGKGLGKIFGGVKRKLAGESLFLTHFSCPRRPGEVGFAGPLPGRLRPVRIEPDRPLLVQKGGFLACEAGVQLGIALTKRLGAGVFGGEGFILQRLSGHGLAFVHAGGDFVDFDLDHGETIQVDTGCIVCFDESVGYSIQRTGGIKASLFGGEGLFLATLTGPGKAVLQTMTLSALRQELAVPASSG